MEKKLFLVWYDPELKEIMNIEYEHATKPLLAQLSKEGIEVCEIYEENLKAANKIFLDKFETLKPNVSFMPSNSDMACSINDKDEYQPFDTMAVRLPSYDSLDQAFNDIEEKAVKKGSKKLH